MSSGISEGAALMALGGGLVVAPFVGWGITAASRPRKTALHLSPTGVFVAGAF